MKAPIIVISHYHVANNDVCDMEIWSELKPFFEQFWIGYWEDPDHEYYRLFVFKESVIQTMQSRIRQEGGDEHHEEALYAILATAKPIEETKLKDEYK